MKPFQSYTEATSSGPVDQLWTKVECFSHTRESEISRPELWLPCLRSWLSAVEWQLKSRDSHLIGVCRWVFLHWNCTPAWQPSQNWGLGFSTQCSYKCRFCRHSDWTSPVHMVACTWLELFPPKLLLHFLQVPLVGMIPISCSRVMVVITMIIFWVARKGECCSQNCLLLTESVKKSWLIDCR